MEQSNGFGIASSLIAAVNTGIFFMIVAVSVIFNKVPLALAFIGLGMCCDILINMVGVALGAVALFKKEPEKIWGIIGICGNTIFLAMYFFFWIVGTVSNGRV